MVLTPLVLTAIFLLLILQIVTIIRVERINARMIQFQDANKKASTHKSSKKEFNSFKDVIQYILIDLDVPINMSIYESQKIKDRQIEYARLHPK